MKNNIIEKFTEKGYLGDFSLKSVEWWLRDEKHIHCEIFFSMFHKKWSINNYFIDLRKFKKIDHELKEIKFESYNEALEYAVEQMLLKV